MSETFQGENGIELYYQSWYPQAQAKAVLVIVHGHGGHTGILARMVEYFVERNYIIETNGSKTPPSVRC